MNKTSIPYQALCTEYYELDKPTPPDDAFQCYLRYAEDARGPILEPMCGTGRFLIPLLERGYAVTGFDYSPHMLDVCRRKCQERRLTGILQEATFATFSSQERYNLIFIPSGSFCLLTTPHQAVEALDFIFKHLKPGGKFVFEIDTLKGVGTHEGIWKGSWVSRSDGSKIALNTLSRFDPISQIETTLCRYELWEENKITRTEVEDFRLRLYDPLEIGRLLGQHGLEMLGMWPSGPSTHIEAPDTAATILCECVKRL